MKAAQSILATWDKFNDFPMETLTKIWVYNSASTKKQRALSLMKEHREQYGMSGNCFDLAIWLLDEFKKDGVQCYPIGDQLMTEDAHAAVIAVCEEGKRYYCDLGDQWITPILIDSECEDFTNEILSGFFPGAQVQVHTAKDTFQILYHRPNGKTSKQVFDPKPVSMDFFLKAAELSQNTISSKPLVECRVPYDSEIAHWEFYNWESFLSTNDGLFLDPTLVRIEDWVERIFERTGYNREILVDVLKFYRNMKKY